MSALALWLGVGAFGGIGAIARFLVDGIVSARVAGAFPAGTLLVNLTGTVVLGLLVGLALHGHGYLLAGTAAIGSYTTFSTWMFESQRLVEEGRLGALVLNVSASLALGLGAAELGRALGGG